MLDAVTGTRRAALENIIKALSGVEWKKEKKKRERRKKKLPASLIKQCD